MLSNSHDTRGTRKSERILTHNTKKIRIKNANLKKVQKIDSRHSTSQRYGPYCLKFNKDSHLNMVTVNIGIYCINTLS